MLLLDRRIFGGQTEGVKAHREQDIVALHALEARAGIAGRHRVPVADVQVSGRIGQHRHGVIFLLCRDRSLAIQAGLCPTVSASAVRFPVDCMSRSFLCSLLHPEESGRLSVLGDSWFRKLTACGAKSCGVVLRGAVSACRVADKGQFRHGRYILLSHGDGDNRDRPLPR